MSLYRHVLCRVLPYVRKCSLIRVPHLHRTPYISSFFSMYSTVERGTPNTKDYRMYFKDEEGIISPFHDIPLRTGKENVFNMIVEVPRWTNAKMEISTKEPLNPIKQDVKKDKLRYVHNCFPHHGYIWNYGAFPQTWENPDSLDEATGCKGDNDPLDVCEIGYRVFVFALGLMKVKEKELLFDRARGKSEKIPISDRELVFVFRGVTREDAKVAKRGDVLQVKVLGIMALIDEGETDWKVLAIDINDPLAEQLNNIEDVEKQMPGYLKATHEWFRIYKVPDGKPENNFAFNGEPKNKEFALKIVEETNKYWQTLITSTEENVLNRSNVTVENSPHKISRDEALDIFNKSSEPSEAGLPIEPIVDKWHYVHLQK